MNDDEIIRLILDTGPSPENVERIIGKLQSLKTTGQQLEQAYEVVGDSFQVMESKVETASDAAVRALVEQTTAQKNLAMALEDTAVATQTTVVSAGGLGQTMSKEGNLGRGVLQASFAFQDFTSQMDQGFARAAASVQNNIPIILSSLGAGAGMAGVISVVTVGLGLLAQNWDKVMGAFGQAAKDQIPRLGEGLDGLKDSLKEIDDQIEKLEKQAKGGGLNLFDEEKLQKLRGLKTEGQQRTEDEKLVGSVGGLDTKQVKAIASAVREALAETGGGEAAARTLAMNTGMSGQEATAIVAGAMRGNGADLQTLLAQNPTLAEAWNVLSPQAKERAKQAQKALEDEQKFQTDRMKQIQHTEETLTGEGAANEVDWRRGMQREKDEDARTAQQVAVATRQADAEAKRKADKAAHDALPENVLARQRQEEERAAIRAVQNVNQQQGLGMDANTISSVARDALNRLPQTGGDGAQAVIEAIQAAFMRGRQNQQQFNQRLNTFSESFGNW
jgi:archaellum component FlaC